MMMMMKLEALLYTKEVDKSDLTIQEKIAIDELQAKSSYSKKRADIAKKISLNRKEERRTETKVKNYCIVKIAS
ncbi:hypothetical protein RhiirA4_483686 [Rhizophagus irregularis]|uniref:Uncharacterized protein n=1 Tax=Rhizophagus irregularis TaxID=588596 RepID=A0A2I1HMX5_9GLOM|nr:hypothetical protein RhiirA4_483686 [Rhizophagus irregularis]